MSRSWLILSGRRSPQPKGSTQKAFGWVLLIPAAALGGCLSHPPPPPAPYHAVGANARWHLVIDDKHVTFLPQDGQPVREPRPQAIVGVAGDIYQTPRINVNIVHIPCTLSDQRSYPDRVQVSVDGVLHEGCGGR